MNSTPLVTVLLITYNHAKSFEKAIQSVLCQKTTFPFQIIILDDASTDGTSEIVQKYAQIKNVKCIIRDKNIGGTLNIYEGLKLVNTKYYATLETDDYWCDDNKLQMQVDILEQNPDCSFCAHETLVKYTNDKTHLFIKSKTGKFDLSIKKIPSKKYLEPHTSSRLYRTNCLDLNNISEPTVATYDIASNFYYLTKGKLYYIDKVMSVYNYTNSGVYSSASPYMQRYRSANIIRILNKEFGYKYNYLLARFFSTRLNLNVFTYLFLKNLKNTKKLEKMYENILSNYSSKYLNNRDKKPILQFNIPVNKKCSLVLEIRREKDRV